jgi:hypothetical protein
MGLDVDIVKIDKVLFDLHVDKKRKVSYSSIDKEDTEQLAYYRRYFDVRDLLAKQCDGMYQCDYHELTNVMLKAALDDASTGEWCYPDEIKELANDLERILSETDFETEVIALSWCS